MKRRDFLALTGSAAVFPGASLAQLAAGKVPRAALVAAGVPVDQMTIGGDRTTPSFSAGLLRTASLRVAQSSTTVT
jgi:hypothetical protein